MGWVRAAAGGCRTPSWPIWSTGVHGVDAALAALRLRLVAEANWRELGAAAGTGVAATSTAAWLAAVQRLTRREAGRQVRLAADLDTRYERVRVALAAGRLSVEQAQVVGPDELRVCWAVGCSR